MAFKISKYLQDLIIQSLENIDSEILEPGSYTFPEVSGIYLGGSGVMPSFGPTATWQFPESLTVKSGETLVVKPFEFAEVIKSQPTQEADDGVRRRIKRGGYTSA